MEFYDHRQFKFVFSAHYSFNINFMHIPVQKIVKLVIFFTGICNKSIVQQCAVNYFLHCRSATMQKKAHFAALHLTLLAPKLSFVAIV